MDSVQTTPGKAGLRGAGSDLADGSYPALVQEFNDFGPA
jgi:hypothetical protein